MDEQRTTAIIDCIEATVTRMRLFTVSVAENSPQLKKIRAIDIAKGKYFEFKERADGFTANSTPQLLSILDELYNTNIMQGELLQYRINENVDNYIARSLNPLKDKPNESDWAELGRALMLNMIIKDINKDRLKSDLTLKKSGPKNHHKEMTANDKRNKFLALWTFFMKRWFRAHKHQLRELETSEIITVLRNNPENCHVADFAIMANINLTTSFETLRGYAYGGKKLLTDYEKAETFEDMPKGDIALLHLIDSPIE